MSGSESQGQEEATCTCILRTKRPLQYVIFTSFPHSCNNVLLQKVVSTCIVAIKWSTQHAFTWSSTSRNIEVLLFQVLAPSGNSTLPCYSNVRPEMNQISCLYFALAQKLMVYAVILTRTRNTSVHRWQV